MYASLSLIDDALYTFGLIVLPRDNSDPNCTGTETYICVYYCLL